MNSGDTKTEALLNILGNGGSYTGISGSGNTKTQNYIIDAIDRIDAVEEEMEWLKNNPDVVDVVATYADLQAYDTSTLTDKDIIRVLEDSTKGNASTYYRWSASNEAFTFIGAIASGGITELTAADYNYDYGNTGSNNMVALWLLDEGIYFIQSPSVKVSPTSNNYQSVQPLGWSNYSRFFMVGATDQDGTKGIILIHDHNTGTNGRFRTITRFTVDATTGTRWNIYSALDDESIVDDLNHSTTYYVLSANQGKVLNDKITPISGSGAPTTATVGILGKIYIDTDTDTAYMCVKVSSGVYTWKKITA